MFQTLAQKDTMFPNNGNPADDHTQSLLDFDLPPSDSQPTAPSQQVFVVNLNLPKFTSDSPEIWFAIAEADFAANCITSDNQKYSQILKALPLNIYLQLWDIIGNAPLQNKYLTLKNAILSRFSDSKQTQLRKILRDMTLGDKKPSQLLREMRELVKGRMGDEDLHQVWRERLPASVRPYLLLSPNLNLNSLAEFADRVLNMSSSSVFALHHKDQQQSAVQKLFDLQFQALQMTLKSYQLDLNNFLISQQQVQKQLTEIKLLQQQHIQLIKNQSQPNSRSKQDYRRSRSRSRSLTPNHNGYCHYHSRWGNQSRKCVQPCKFGPAKPKNAGI